MVCPPLVAVLVLEELSTAPVVIAQVARVARRFNGAFSEQQPINTRVESCQSCDVREAWFPGIAKLVSSKRRNLLSGPDQM